MFPGYSSHYNAYRDYDSATGRYVESDPLGCLEEVTQPTPMPTETLPVSLIRWGLHRLRAPVLRPRFPLYCHPTSRFRGLRKTTRGSSRSGTGGRIPTRLQFLLAHRLLRQMVAKLRRPLRILHEDEAEALYFTPDPWGGNEACQRLARAIRVLRAQIAWRQTDLDPFLQSYAGHVQRVSILRKAPDKLEEAHRNICGKDCPP